jgi:transcriptional regulator with XRE-family HTH domain
MARVMASAIGQEVLLARANLALTRRQAARLARVSPQTQDRVERGDPSVAIDTACRVASGVGLKLWAKAFPASDPSLRDTGQLRIAECLKGVAHARYTVALELALSNGRSADEVFFGPNEILHAEIERRLADWQHQHRRANAKRDELAAAHQRPVRLVIVVEDTERNRSVAREHASLIGSMLPAGSREVARSLRSGEPLGKDGILWIRPRDAR